MWLNNAMTSIKVSFTQPELQPAAENLGQRLGVSVVSADEIKSHSKVANSSDDGCDYVLQFDTQGLSLLPLKGKQHGPIRCDFDSGVNTHRRKFGGGNGQAIAKAVGVSGKFLPGVLDLTAGLGGDGFVLASLGCQVHLLERNLVVHSLLRDGLDRAIAAGADDSELGDIVARISLLEGDSKTYLAGLASMEQEDTVFLDPMFPERKKSAKVKKEMQAFHEIVGGDSDAGELLDLALQRARYRVVVKRSASAGYLAGMAPSYSLEGKSTRFDIFALKKLPG
jgi:16S rRNA (guanine1516-N2)-methyltransferase